MKNTLETDVEDHYTNKDDEILKSTKVEYWDTDLQNYNFKGSLSSLINPVEFKKKLETVNLLIAIITLIVITGFFLI